MAQIVLWSSKAIVIQTWKQFWIFAGSWWPWTAFDSLGIWYSQNASSLVKVVSSLNRILNNINLLLISTQSDKGRVFSHKFHPKRIVLSSTLNYILQRLRVDMCGDFCNGIGFYVMLTEVILHLKKMLPWHLIHFLHFCFFQAPAFFKALLPLGEDPDTLGYICAIPLLGRLCLLLLIIYLILSKTLTMRWRPPFVIEHSMGLRVALSLITWSTLDG